MTDPAPATGFPTPRRAAIESQLNESRNKTLGYFLAMSPAELAAPRTPSEHDPQNRWSALDHLSHLAFIETNFVAIVRRHLAGRPDPVGLVSGDEPRPARERVIARVHELTETDQRAHHHLDLDAVIARTCRARAATLALLSELRDEQLAERIAGAPWGEGTVGGVLLTNAGHATMHAHWVRDAG